MAKKSRSHASAPSPMLDKDYHAEDDHRTLTRAQEIAEDKGRMSGVRKHHKKMTRSLSKVGAMMKGGR
jgi:hypothetical protein